MKEKGRNLMEDLMEEGIRLIMERGVEGFSNRAVAERCHVFSLDAPFSSEYLPASIISPGFWS